MQVAPSEFRRGDNKSAVGRGTGPPRAGGAGDLGQRRFRGGPDHGGDLLLDAARDAGMRRIVAQSYACHRYARTGGPVKTEDDPLDPAPPAAMRQTLAAMAHLDQAVTAAGGIALRYGNFYGDPDGLVAAVRTRKFPIVGAGAGVWSHIHLEDAAAATVLALEHDGPAIYNIVDDEPAPAGVWLPELAKILGAPPPQHYPRLLARLFAREAPVIMATESRGASNAKAKRELGWTLRYPAGARASQRPTARRDRSRRRGSAAGLPASRRPRLQRIRRVHRRAPTS
jgi:hypothetical protein